MTKAAAIHLLTELAPVSVFFIVGQFYDFLTCVLILVMTTLGALFISWIYERRLPFLAIFSTLFIVVFGLITLVYKSPDVFIFADSLYYFTCAAAVGYGLLRRHLYLKWLFERTFAMSDEGWYILSLRWLYLFIFAGVANELVRILFTPDIWIDYKFLKVLLIAGFGMYQFTLSRRFRIPELSNKWGLRLTKLPYSHRPE